MADIKTAVADRRDNPPGVFPGFWIAKVTLPVPVVETGLLWVTIPDIDHNSKWGPCHWTPRSKQAVINVAEGAEPAHNISVMIRVLPVYGDTALVVFDNRGNPWVVSYGS